MTTLALRSLPLIVSAPWLPWPVAVWLGILLLFVRAAGALETFPSSGWDSEATAPIEVSAVAEGATPSLTFRFWRIGQYVIYRKAPDALTWGLPYASTSLQAAFWTDQGVTIGTEYEYRFVLKTPDPLAGRSATGDFFTYLRAGIRVDRTHSRGHLAVLIAQDAYETLPREISRYLEDLRGDGWEAHPIFTPRGVFNKDLHPMEGDADLHREIRNQVKALYATWGSQLRHVMVLGHVPIVRSGTYNGRPDGHGFGGAVGADGYYAHMGADTEWTDNADNSSVFTKLLDPKRNVPGDGRYDQDILPWVELGYSRIDMALTSDEFAKLRIYLDKLHRYKHAAPDFRPGRRVCARNFYDNPMEICWSVAPALVGMQNLVSPLTDVPRRSNFDMDQDWSASSGPYLFYFKGSQYPNMNATGGRAVFWTGLQSHYGYWDTYSWMADQLGEDNFALSWTWSIWGNRWNYQSLSLGDVMGTVVRQSVNNRAVGAWSAKGPYYPEPSQDPQEKWHLYRYETQTFFYQSYAGGGWFNHYGDVALRLFMFPPASDLAVNPTASGAQLSWTASPEPDLLGYHVYRSAAPDGLFERLTSVPVIPTIYTDAQKTSGTWTYMVRAVKLDRTGSGTFLNASQGIFRTATWAPTALTIPAATLPDGNLFTAYAAALSAAGGVPPYQWGLASGSLPTGLALQPDGRLSGAPKAAGTFACVVRVTDVRGTVATRSATLTVANAVLYEAPLIADAYTQAGYDVNLGAEEYLSFGSLTGTKRYFAKFDLSRLPAGQVAHAILRLQNDRGGAAAPDQTAVLTAALTTDASDVWTEGTGSTSLQVAVTSTDTAADAILTRNNLPPLNAGAPVGTVSGPFTFATPVDIDVTGLVRANEATDAQRIVGVQLGVSNGTLYVCAREHPNHALVAPRLLVAITGTPPSIALTSPASGRVATRVSQPLRLAAVVSDDGIPGTGVTTVWTKVSGPGAVTFSAPGGTSTRAVCAVAGNYVVRLTASDGQMSSTRDVTIVVEDFETGDAPFPDVCWLRFEETSGATVANSVPGAPAATLVNGTAATWTASGRLGRGLDLRQETGIAHVIVAHDGVYPIRPDQEWTISYWVRKPDRNSGGTSLSKYLQATPVVSELEVSETSASVLTGRSGTGMARIDYPDAGRTLSDGNWHLITMRKKADELLLGVDAWTAVALSTNLGVATNVQDVLLGTRRGADNLAVTGDWDGLIDDFRIYGRALSIEEIVRLANPASLNRAPAVVITAPTTGQAGTALTLAAAITDDGLPAAGVAWRSWEKVSGPGTAAFSAPGEALTRVTVDAAGSYVFRLIAGDGDATTEVQTGITFSGTVANRPPTVQARSLSMNEDGTLTITLAGTDPDGDPLTFAAANPANGVLTTTATPGVLTYKPRANFFGTDSFTYTASDGSLASAPATVSIVVAPVNDAPVAYAQSVAARSGTPVPFTLGATDVEGDALDYQIGSPLAVGTGTLDISRAPVITYTPPAGFVGSATFTFKAVETSTSPALSSRAATVTIQVSTAFQAKINFQPRTAPLPAGWILDGGELYGPRNGLTYGWNTDFSVGSFLRDRNNAVSPDQMHDTLLIVGGGGSATADWSILVPNGTYTVMVVAGDPLSTVQPDRYRFALQGGQVVEGQTTLTQRWYEHAQRVSVVNGRLTFSFIGGMGIENKICSITIVSDPTGNG